MLLRKEDNMARPNYIHEWENMPRCYNPLDCPFKAEQGGRTLSFSLYDNMTDYLQNFTFTNIKY